MKKLLLAAPLMLTFLAVPAFAQDADIPAVEAVVGQAAPDFTLTDQTGTEHTLSDYQGQVVVLEWTNPGCPFVVRHYDADTMENLQQQYAENVVWFAVDSSDFVTAEAVQEWTASEGLGYATLLDAPGTVGHRYGATNTPQMFVIDAEGTLAYAGAIDTDPRGNQSPEHPEFTNYVSDALLAVTSGSPVTTSSTDPYGCSVKYEGTY